MARTVAAAYATEGSGSTPWSRATPKRPWSPPSRDNAAERAAIVSRIPLGRPGRPEDVEGIMVYLASDDPATPPVVLFRVDGGMTAL